jgi:prophage tail gpP-like protein
VIEQYARHVGVYLTSNPKGDLVALPGAPPGGGGTFVEGKNILEAREVIFNQSYQGQYGNGQLPPSDDNWGAKTTSVPFIKGDPSGLISGKGLAGTASEIPAWTQEHLKSRIAHEKAVIDNDAVTVQVTVQGWLSGSGGGLWGPPRTPYTVTSPMLVANGMSLALKEVTFTQDNKTGTRSQITLCNDIAMNEGIPALSGSQVSGGPSQGTDPGAQSGVHT